MFSFVSVTDIFGSVVPAVALLLLGGVVGTLLGAFIAPVGDKARKRGIALLLLSLPLVILLYVSPPMLARAWERLAEPHLQPELSVKLEGRVHGGGDWRQTFIAKPGDKIDLLLSYQDTGMGQADDVVVRVNGAPGLIPQPWTSYFYFSSFPGGLPALGTGSDDGTDLFSSGWNVGSYLSGANGYATIVVDVPRKQPTKGDMLTSIGGDGLVTFKPVAVVKCAKTGEFYNTCQVVVKY